MHGGGTFCTLISQSQSPPIYTVHTTQQHTGSNNKDGDDDNSEVDHDHDVRTSGGVQTKKTQRPKTTQTNEDLLKGEEADRKAREGTLY